LLSYPIPRLVWLDSKKYHNKDFINFVESKPEGVSLKHLIKSRKHKLSTSKRWNILILSVYPDKLIPIVSNYGDKFYVRDDQQDEVTKDSIKEQGIDFIITFGYGKILKADLLKLVTAINIHPGYLPYNRGPNPNLWSFMDDTPKGVTIHYVDEGIDTGDIIAQKKVSFSGDVSKVL